MFSEKKMFSDQEASMKKLFEEEDVLKGLWTRKMFQEELCLVWKIVNIKKPHVQ
jgi:hypothetical protein